jgi:hypothetical protein
MTVDILNANWDRKALRRIIVCSRIGEIPPYGILEGAMETEQGWDSEALSTERGRNR